MSVIARCAVDGKQNKLRNKNDRLNEYGKKTRFRLRFSERETSASEESARGERARRV